MVQNHFESETQTSSENHLTVTAWFTCNDKLDTITTLQPWTLALFSFILQLFFTFSTTNHREPLSEITAPHWKKTWYKKAKKCLGRYVSRGCDWLVMKKVEKKAIVFTVRVSALKAFARKALKPFQSSMRFEPIFFSSSFSCFRD